MNLILEFVNFQNKRNHTAKKKAMTNCTIYFWKTNSVYDTYIFSRIRAAPKCAASILNVRPRRSQLPLIATKYEATMGEIGGLESSDSSHNSQVFQTHGQFTRSEILANGSIRGFRQRQTRNNNEGAESDNNNDCIDGVSSCMKTATTWEDEIIWRSVAA